ncbi:MAG TPA: DUF423 domain-containing protein [Hyphomicrobiales bacterium]|nr:DUF423 domain-containing protein [Hyphomicrobiales bacterium]
MAAWNALVLVLSGLMGAAGVGLAAIAAHLSGGEFVLLAATFLLFHAAAGAAVTVHGPAAGRRGTVLLAAATLLVVGATLFSGDLAARGLADTPLLTAPVGGSVMILGWLILAAAAFFRAG